MRSIITIAILVLSVCFLSACGQQANSNAENKPTVDRQHFQYSSAVDLDPDMNPRLKSIILVSTRSPQQVSLDDLQSAMNDMKDLFRYLNVTIEQDKARWDKIDKTAAENGLVKKEVVPDRWPVQMKTDIREAMRPFAEEYSRRLFDGYNHRQREMTDELYVLGTVTDVMKLTGQDDLIQEIIPANVQRQMAVDGVHRRVEHLMRFSKLGEGDEVGAALNIIAEYVSRYDLQSYEFPELNPEIWYSIQDRKGK